MTPPSDAIVKIFEYEAARSEDDSETEENLE